MKRLFILIYILALIISAKATAQQLRFDANVEVQQGQTASLSIVMDNAEAVRGFQFDLTLPSGLSPTISKVGETNHDITVSKVGESQWRVLSYSMTNAEYAANYGIVATLSIPVPEEYKVGNYSISASNAYLSAHNNSKITVANFSADLNVLQREIFAEAVTLNQTSLTLKIGEEETLTATVLPENTTDKTVTWTSSNAEVATVDANGKVTAITVGTAIISATCGSVAATCEVIVNPTIGDANGDGKVSVADVVLACNIVLADEYDAIVDINGDGVVSVADVVLIVNLALIDEE